LVPVTVTSLPPPAAPFVGLTELTVGARGNVPPGADVLVAGLPSAEDTSAVVEVWISDWVTLVEVTTAFTVNDPLVNGLVVLVHEIDCPTGTAHVQPVPEAPTGTTPLGSV
jgi:hypothetical protein